MERFLEKKVAVVTGAAGDIGREVSAQLLAAGARVVAADLNEEALQALVAQLSSAGEILAVPTDVRDEDSLAALMSAAAQNFGGLDILFNNAGTEGQGGDITELSAERFDQVMAVNVRGVFLGIKHATPLLRARGGGSIINTASIAGLSGAGHFSVYSASKHAVIGLSRSAAQTLGPDNIRVNAICPSPVDGRMMASIEGQLDPDNPADAHAQMLAAVPLGRYAQPKDVANLVLFLCRPESDFLNGGRFTVDGGATA